LRDNYFDIVKEYWEAGSDGALMAAYRRDLAMVPVAEFLERETLARRFWV
jgi:hypothetical protein